MSNLRNFVTEAEKVLDWYLTFAENRKKVEGPGSIIGMEFWDGGDDIDYIGSAILGFCEHSDVFATKEDYLGYFIQSDYLSEDSSSKWKNKITNLANLFGMLSDEEKLNLWKSFPDEFDPDWYEDEEDYPTLDNRWSKYYSQSKVIDSSVSEESINSVVESNSNLTISLTNKILSNVENYFNQKGEYDATIVDKDSITVKDNRNNKSITFKLKSKLVPYFTIIDDIGELICPYLPNTDEVERKMVENFKYYLSEVNGSATESVKSNKKSKSATESFDPIEKEIYGAMKNNRTNIL